MNKVTKLQVEIGKWVKLKQVAADNIIYLQEKLHNEYRKKIIKNKEKDDNIPKIKFNSKKSRSTKRAA